MKKLLLPVIGLLAGLLISFAVPPVYVSKATLVFQNADGATAASSREAIRHRSIVDFYLQCQAEVLSRNSLSALIQSPELRLYADDLQKLPIEDVIQNMRPNLQIRIVDRPGYPRETSTVFEIAFSYPDSPKAQATTQKLITSFLDVGQARNRTAAQAPSTRVDQLEARLAAVEKKLNIGVPAERLPDVLPITLQVIEPASLPDKPVSPNRWIFMGVGFAAGLLALIAMVILKDVVLKK